MQTIYWHRIYLQNAKAILLRIAREKRRLTPDPGLTPDPSPKGEGNIKGEGSK